ncbi:MAG: hypothetical protein WCQ32_01025 [bacterium]
MDISYAVQELTSQELAQEIKDAIPAFLDKISNTKEKANAKNLLELLSEIYEKIPSQKDDIVVQGTLSFKDEV